MLAESRRDESKLIHRVPSQQRRGQGIDKRLGVEIVEGLVYHLAVGGCVVAPAAPATVAAD
jgi:hypothetical protein